MITPQEQSIVARATVAELAIEVAGLAQTYGSQADGSAKAALRMLEIGADEHHSEVLRMIAESEVYLAVADRLMALAREWATAAR